MSFRDLVGTIAPPWLQRQYGERLLYAVTLQVDAIAEAAREGVRARAPGSDQSPPGALLQIGRDRVIVRGKYESDAIYAGRLQRAFASWARAGSLEGLTRALQALLLDGTAKARAITWWGLWAYIHHWDDPIEYTYGSQAAWHWGWDVTEPIPQDWASVFVIIHPSQAGRWAQAELGAGLVLGSGQWSVGIAEPPDVVGAARLVARAWKSATTQVRVIVSYDSAWPSHPTSPAEVVDQADRTWKINHTVDESGTSRPSRYLRAAYLDPIA